MSIAEETSWCMWPPTDFSQTLGPRFRIAVITGSRHLDTAPPRVKGVMCPSDSRVFSHCRRCDPIRVTLYSYHFHGKKNPASTKLALSASVAQDRPNWSDPPKSLRWSLSWPPVKALAIWTLCPSAAPNSSVDHAVTAFNSSLYGTIGE